MKKKIIIVALVIFGFIVLAVLFLPTVYDPPDERLAALEMRVCSQSIRDAVGKSLLAGTTIPENFKIVCDWVISSIKVMPNGEIYLFNSEYDVKIQLYPEIKGTEVNWFCKVTPEMPSGYGCPHPNSAPL